MPQSDNSRPRRPQGSGARKRPGTATGRTSSKGSQKDPRSVARSADSPASRSSRSGQRSGQPRAGDARERPSSSDSDSSPRRGGARRERPTTGSAERRSAGGERRRGDERRSGEFRTEADKRRAAVRARGAGSARDPKIVEQQARSDKPVPEEWIDEGPIRSRATEAVKRGRSGVRRDERRTQEAIDPAVVEVVARAVDPRRAEKLAQKLNSACTALDRERYSEAKRIARSLLKELSSVSTVHEVIGLASYRLGQWRDATAALETAQRLNERVENMPVLLDCYRAQKRWSDVDMVWKDLKDQSPAPDVMAEGRIVVAGSFADRGDLRAAIDLMQKVLSAPRRIREYHVRQWYVLADLYDRAGDIQRARELFSRVAAADPQFADVRERLSSL
ncbi:MAG: hypothetical protein RLZ37_2048 [Actinomycetota bacterium]